MPTTEYGCWVNYACAHTPEDTVSEFLGESDTPDLREALSFAYREALAAKLAPLRVTLAGQNLYGPASYKRGATVDYEDIQTAIDSVDLDEVYAQLS